MKQAVTIKPYDSKMPDYFKREKGFLNKNLGNGFEIQHVGSSAVPGLGGKNVLDIQLLAPNKSVAKKTVKKLESVGYVQNKDAGDEYRIFFNRNRSFDDRKIHIHLHLMWKTADKYKEQLMFMDYLREHPEEAERYFSLKKVLARKAGDKREKYTEAKTDYIKSVLEKARKEFKL